MKIQRDSDLWHLVKPNRARCRLAYEPHNELLAYLGAGRAWTGSDAQLRAKTAGLVKLIVGSSDYQFV